MTESNKPFILPCFKTREIQVKFDQGQALIYLKLRNNNCSMKKSLSFCKVKHCKTDTTALVTGPENHRILKYNQNKLYQNNIINGWLMNVNPEFDMGNHFIMNKNRHVLKTDYIDDKIVKDLERQNNSLKHDFKQREKYLKQYMSEIEQLYDFKSLNRSRMHNKLQEIISEADKFNLGTVECYKFKNDNSDFKLLEITSYFKEKEKQFIHPLGSYPSLINEQQENMLVKTEYKREEKPEYLIDYQLAQEEENTNVVIDPEEKTLPQFSKEAKLRALQEQFNDSIYLIHNENKSFQNKKVLANQENRSMTSVQFIGNSVSSSFMTGNKKAIRKHHEKHEKEMDLIENGYSKPRKNNEESKQKILVFPNSTKNNKKDNTKNQYSITASNSPAQSHTNKSISNLMVDQTVKNKLEFDQKLKNWSQKQIDILYDVSLLKKADNIDDQNLKNLINIKNQQFQKNIKNCEKPVKKIIYQLNRRRMPQSDDSNSKNNSYYFSKIIDKRKSTKDQFCSPNTSTTMTQTHHRFNSHSNVIKSNFVDNKLSVPQSSYQTKENSFSNQ